MSSISNLNSALFQLMNGSSSGGFDFSILARNSGSGVTTAAVSPGAAKDALAKAETNEKKQLEAAAKDPQVVKDLARYEKVLKSAKSIQELLDDPVARKVFLKANGLGDQVDAVVLAKRALASDPADPAGLANKLSGVNSGWYEAAKTYNFHLFGLNVLGTADEIKTIKGNYVAEKRLDNLDKQMPGLGQAVMFKKIAKNLDTPLKILGSPLGRDVVTTALGISRQIALQSIVAQEKAISSRLNVSQLKSDAHVDRLLERYLIRLNGGLGGVTA